MPSCYLLIADDNSTFVESVQRCLMLESEAVVVEQAHTASDTIRQIVASKPDIVFLNITLPGANGLALVQSIKTLVDAPTVIVLALDDLEDYRIAATAAGADGFLAKTNISVDKLLALCAVRSAF